MGGDLPPHPAKDYAKAPKFAVWALKDPMLLERAWSSPIWYTPPAELIERPPFYPGLQPYLP